MAFPLFVLAVGVAAALGNSVSSVVVATVVVNLPLYARQTRSDVSRRRDAGYVEAARLAGFGRSRSSPSKSCPMRCPR